MEEEEEELDVAAGVLFTAVTVGGCESAVWCGVYMFVVCIVKINITMAT